MYSLGILSLSLLEALYNLRLKTRLITLFMIGDWPLRSCYRYLLRIALLMVLILLAILPCCMLLSSASSRAD